MADAYRRISRPRRDAIASLILIYDHTGYQQSVRCNSNSNSNATGFFPGTNDGSRRRCPVKQSCTKNMEQFVFGFENKWTLDVGSLMTISREVNVFRPNPDFLGGK